jgi:uncharacterized membrane protein YfcA
MSAAIAGGLLGGALAARIAPDRLRRWFGWLVLIMAIVILGAEVPRLIWPMRSIGAASCSGPPTGWTWVGRSGPG